MLVLHVTLAPKRDSQFKAGQLGALSEEDLTGDVARVIRASVVPYVDHTNCLMEEEELQAECWARLARIIDGGHLLKCPTRAKAFAFIKTAMRNHVRVLVQKLAFAQKRTGIKHPSRRFRNQGGGTAIRKLAKVSLDNGNHSSRIGSADPGFRRLEFLEELSFRLTCEERLVFTVMLAGGAEDTTPSMRVVAARIRKKARAVIEGED